MKRNETKADELESKVEYFNSIKQYNLLTPEEEHELLVRACNGDKTAKEKLIIHNQRLIISIVNKRSRDMNILQDDDNYMDLIQAGNIGMQIAIDKFDFSKAKGNKRFTTYATIKITEEVNKELNYLSEIKENDVKNKNNINKVCQKYAYEHDSFPESVDELLQYWKENSERLGIKPIGKRAYYNTMEIYNIKATSGDIPVGDEDSEETKLDFAPDDADVNIFLMIKITYLSF